MRFTHLFFAGIVLLIAGTGCCKLLCSDERLDLQLSGFPPSATDTILVSRYTAATGFLQVLDSQYYFPPVFTQDTIYLAASADNANLLDFDFTVQLSGINKEYRIAHINTSSAKCPCGGGTYKTIQGAEVNGLRQSGHFIELRP